MTKDEHATFITQYYGVSIDVLKQLGLEEDISTYLFTQQLIQNESIIKAIREDDTGFTAAMYGITNNN